MASIILQARHMIEYSKYLALGGNQRSSEVIRGHQRSSEVIRGHQRSSEVIRGHQRSSEVIRCSPYLALGGTRRLASKEAYTPSS